MIELSPKFSSVIHSSLQLVGSRNENMQDLAQDLGVDIKRFFQNRNWNNLPLASQDLRGFNFSGSLLLNTGIEQALNIEALLKNDEVVLIDAVFDTGSKLISLAFAQKMRRLGFMKALEALNQYVETDKPFDIELFYTLFALMPQDLQQDCWLYKAKCDFESLNQKQKQLAAFVLLHELKDFLPENGSQFASMAEKLSETCDLQGFERLALAISNSINLSFLQKLEKLMSFLSLNDDEIEALIKSAKSDDLSEDETVAALAATFAFRGLRAIEAHHSWQENINTAVVLKYLQLKTKGNYELLTPQEISAIDEYYKKAIAIAPNNATINGNYANLLRLLKRYDEAEQYYKKALAIEPNDAINNGNYAYFLFVLGRDEEAKTFLEIAQKNNPPTQLQLELFYYRLAFLNFNAISPVKQMLLQEVRSEGFDLEQSLERAKAINHPHLEMLKVLVAVITKGEDIAKLNIFPEWVAA